MHRDQQRLALGALAVGLGLAAGVAAAGPADADTPDSAQQPRTRQAVAAVGVSAGRTATKPVGTWRAPGRRAAATARPAIAITRSGQSPVTVSSGRTGAAELSGIASAGGTSFYAVGDNSAGSIWRLYVSSDARDGRIRSALVDSAISAQVGSDAEGIALNPSRSQAWIANEATSTITEFSLDTGQRVGAVAVPAIYRPENVQDNRGLEALSYGAGRLWTANEEALRPDGPLATTSAGSWVRLQSFGGPEMAPQGQYGYLTDPISAMSPFVSVERSGLVDLVALPTGDVLALERELGGFVPLFRSRIYLLDFSAATDVSALPSLADGGFTAVGKTLLWQGYFAFINFEGITLAAPATDSASPTLLLISDDGGGELGQRQVISSLLLRTPSA